MKNIAIITDTDSSLPADIADQNGIQLVPITIHFDSQSYTTGKDIDDRLLFQKIDRLNKLPTTSAPSPSAFACAYQDAFNSGADAIICICVSSKVSATYNSALTARELFVKREIRVIDSLNLSMGQGFMALAAAEVVQQGASLEEAVNHAIDAGKRVHTYAVLSTLKYLALSGRVGKLAAGMANTFDIKPILTVREGKLDLLEKVRSRKKAIERMLDLLCIEVGGKPVQRATMIHVNNLDGAKDVQKQLCSILPCPSSVLTAEFTPGLSVHGGSGVVGVVLMV